MALDDLISREDQEYIRSKLLYIFGCDYDKSQTREMFEKLVEQHQVLLHGIRQGDYVRHNGKDYYYPRVNPYVR